jgi:hypothetical protein
VATGKAVTREPVWETVDAAVHAPLAAPSNVRFGYAAGAESTLVWRPLCACVNELQLSNPSVTTITIVHRHVIDPSSLRLMAEVFRESQRWGSRYTKLFDAVCHEGKGRAGDEVHRARIVPPTMRAKRNGNVLLIPGLGLLARLVSFFASVVATWST